MRYRSISRSIHRLAGTAAAASKRIKNRPPCLTVELNPSAGPNTGRSAEMIALEDMHGAHNYHPIPVVLERGQLR